MTYDVHPKWISQMCKVRAEMRKRVKKRVPFRKNINTKVENKAQRLWEKQTRTIDGYYVRTDWSPQNFKTNNGTTRIYWLTTKIIPLIRGGQTGWKIINSDTRKPFPLLEIEISN